MLSSFLRSSTTGTNKPRSLTTINNSTPNPPASKINWAKYTSNGTFAVPAGVYWLDVILVGGGGSGGTGGEYDWSGGGGGGGGIIFLTNYQVTPGQQISYTIGSGGAARTGNNQAGVSGGNTTWDTVFIAFGGGNGGSGIAGGGGSGGCGGGGGNASEGSGSGGVSPTYGFGSYWWGQPSALGRRDASTSKPSGSVESRERQGTNGFRLTTWPVNQGGGGGGAAAAATNRNGGAGYAESLTGETWGSGGGGRTGSGGTGYGGRGSGGNGVYGQPSAAGIGGVVLVKW
jgi:hypothetical protein